MFSLKNQGQINIPLLALLAVIGIIIFLLITRSFNFKNPLFGSLYNKTPSQAFDGVQIPDQNPSKTPTTNWTESWSNSPYLSNWNQSNFNCSVAVQEGNLVLNCTSGTLLSKTSLNNSSSVIVNGSFKSGNNSNASVGISSQENTLAKLTTSSPGSNDLQIPNYQPDTMQNFRIVSSIIDNQRFVFYYLGDNPEPVKKGPISDSGDINISLSCQGLCTFGSLVISGVPTQ